MATRQDGVENRDKVYSTGAAFSLSSFTFSLSIYRVCDHLIVFYKSTSSNNRAIHTKNNRKQLPISSRPCMPRTLFKTNLPPPISKNQELCPKSYRRSSAIFCEMGNTLSLQTNKKFLLTFKRYIRKRRVQHNLMRNVRSSKSRLVNCQLTL